MAMRKRRSYPRLSEQRYEKLHAECVIHLKRVDKTGLCLTAIFFTLLIGTTSLLYNAVVCVFLISVFSFAGFIRIFIQISAGDFYRWSGMSVLFAAPGLTVVILGVKGSMMGLGRVNILHYYVLSIAVFVSFSLLFRLILRKQRMLDRLNSLERRFLNDRYRY